jgi:hypothetical protein
MAQPGQIGQGPCHGQGPAGGAGTDPAQRHRPAQRSERARRQRKQAPQLIAGNVGVDSPWRAGQAPATRNLSPLLSCTLIQSAQ